MLSPVIWLSLSQETRQNLVAMLGIPKSGGCEVSGGKLVSDGHTPQDLATITVEKLRQFVDMDTEDFYKLFNELVRRVEMPVEVIEPIKEEVKQIKKPNQEKNAKKSK